MAFDQAKNFVRGLTDASVTDTATTISVADASKFPDPANGEYNLVIWDEDSYPRPDQDPNVEIVRVSASDTTNDDLTVSRGQEDTVGASHPSGCAIQLAPTAKVLTDLQDKLSDGDTVYDIQKNGTDGTGIINFKT